MTKREKNLGEMHLLLHFLINFVAMKGIFHVRYHLNLTAKTGVILRQTDVFIISENIINHQE